MIRLSERLTASILHLDIHTLSEEWILSHAAECSWRLLAQDLDLPPSRWFDASGARMYAAVMGFETVFDLERPVVEDDEIDVESRLVAVRKPHAISHTVYLRQGQPVAEARILTSFVRRDQPGVNKKFSKVHDVWMARDLDPEAVDNWLDRHFALRPGKASAEPVLTHEVNRLQDFNAADLMYFRNFVRLARAAEWRTSRGAPPRLAARRAGYHYGNVEDGEVISAQVAEEAGTTRTLISGPGGRPLFLSIAERPPVTLAVR